MEWVKKKAKRPDGSGSRVERARASWAGPCNFISTIPWFQREIEAPKRLAQRPPPPTKKKSTTKAEMGRTRQPHTEQFQSLLRTNTVSSSTTTRYMNEQKHHHNIIKNMIEIDCFCWDRGLRTRQGWIVLSKFNYTISRLIIFNSGRLGLNNHKYLNMK